MANDQIRSGRLGKRREPSHMQTGTPAALQKGTREACWQTHCCRGPKSPHAHCFGYHAGGTVDANRPVCNLHQTRKTMHNSTAAKPRHDSLDTAMNQCGHGPQNWQSEQQTRRPPCTPALRARFPKSTYSPPNPDGLNIATTAAASAHPKQC